MTKQQKPFDDRRMDAIMGQLLRFGVLLASIVVALGGLLYVRTHARKTADYRVFVSSPFEVSHPGKLFHAVAGGDATAIILLGVLLLIATPIARVLFAVIGFTIERDRLYMAISAFVLVVLLFGLLHGA